MAPKPCIDCGKPTPKTRCTNCETARQHTRNTTRPHYQGNWDTHSRQARAEHVATHGWTCPGWNTPPHPATDLVADHIVARTRQAGTQVLCRSCNSRKSVTERQH